MSAQRKTPRKPCYKCGNYIEVTDAEAANGQRHTTCESCKVKINVEWEQADLHLSKQETAA